jgi:hypothetical protein
MSLRDGYRLLLISPNQQNARIRFIAKPYAALVFRISSLLFILDPNISIAVPYTGTATKANFCQTEPQFCDNADVEGQPVGGAFNLSLVVPTNASGDATFTLSAYGDFQDGTTETFNVNVEGYGLGFFLNNNPDDDQFDNAGFADTGNDFLHVSVASAIIPLAKLLPIIADGTFTATFDSNTGVNDIQGQVSPTIPNQDFNEYISYQLSFEASNIPEPSVLALTALCLMGVGCRRHRKSLANKTLLKRVTSTNRCASA